MKIVLVRRFVWWLNIRRLMYVKEEVMNDEAIQSAKLQLNFKDRLAAILQELESGQGKQWVSHVNTNDYSGGWNVLPLRSLEVHELAHPLLQSFAIESGDNWVNLPIIQELPTIKSVLDSLNCASKSARLMRLEPGAVIKPHCDSQLSIEHGEARLHVPLITNDKVEFLVKTLYWTCSPVSCGISMRRKNIRLGTWEKIVG